MPTNEENARIAFDNMSKSLLGFDEVLTSSQAALTSVLAGLKSEDGAEHEMLQKLRQKTEETKNKLNKIRKSKGSGHDGIKAILEITEQMQKEWL